MKRYLVELPLWCLIAIGALLFTALWAVNALTTNVSGHLTAYLTYDRPFNNDWIAYEYDGSLIAYWSPRAGRAFTNVIDPPTVSGLVAFWWPAGALIGVGLLTLIAALMPTSGPLLRTRIRIPRVRLTLFRLMVVIGTVSAWLWLGRFDPYTIAAGTLIFGFMLHAGFRRSFLAKEANAEAMADSVLSRAGIVGYSLVLLLALAWVISILVWDSYQERRF